MPAPHTILTLMFERYLFAVLKVVWKSWGDSLSPLTPFPYPYLNLPPHSPWAGGAKLRAGGWALQPPYFKPCLFPHWISTSFLQERRLSGCILLPLGLFYEIMHNPTQQYSQLKTAERCNGCKAHYFHAANVAATRHCVCSLRFKSAHTHIDHTMAPQWLNFQRRRLAIDTRPAAPCNSIRATARASHGRNAWPDDDEMAATSAAARVWRPIRRKRGGRPYVKRSRTDHDHPKSGQRHYTTS